MVGITLFVLLIVVPLVGNIWILLRKPKASDRDPYSGGYDDGGFPW